MLDYFINLSKKYSISIENIISIALNRYGIKMDNIEDNRIRFNLKIFDSDIETFFAVCVNTYDKSPFVLKSNKLYLDNNIVGEVSKIEKDTCTSTYFRNNKKAITFNSNSRSKCIGCKFCGTYNLTDDDSYDFSTKKNIINYFERLLKENNINSMQDIESVTICTGCFKNEEELVNHLLLINDSFKEMSYNGDINYIGSQLVSFDKIDLIKEHIDKFGLYLTIEKFLCREDFMRKEKASLTLKDAKDLLKYSSSKGITTTFLYILGLENLETVEKYFNYFKDSINKFPITQIFQNYTKTQEMYRHKDALDIEYYIKARIIIDNIFKEKKLNSKLWECFRGLYYEETKKILKK